MNNKNFSIIGAGLGLAVFLAVGLLPALLYGGYAGVLLAGGIFGTPLTASFVERAVVIFGMVLGTMAVGSLFAVAGAVIGATMGVLVGREPSPQPAKE